LLYHAVPVKAFPPMSVTFSGMVMEVRLLLNCEFIIRFVSIICVLNGRKVTIRILSMQKKIKI